MHETDGAPDKERFMTQIYGELRALAKSYMRRERRDHTLQTTALVNEAYLQIARAEVEITSCEQYLALAATTMRHILVDHARRREVRGGRTPRVSLADVDPSAECADTDFLSLHAALERLEKLSERRARVVVLRFFGGLSIDEVASVMGISSRTVDEEWREAKTWLKNELRGASPA